MMLEEACNDSMTGTFSRPSNNLYHMHSMSAGFVVPGQLHMENLMYFNKMAFHGCFVMHFLSGRYQEEKNLTYNCYSVNMHKPP